jgi:hypothetical protein
MAAQIEPQARHPRLTKPGRQAREETAGTWQTEAKKARRGCLLSPQDFTDGDLIGTRIPRDLLGKPVQPGRGLLHLGDGQLITVQVPLD